MATDIAFALGVVALVGPADAKVGILLTSVIAAALLARASRRTVDEPPPNG
jgi:Na+/H+ antiporter NhaA